MSSRRPPTPDDSDLGERPDESLNAGSEAAAEPTRALDEDSGLAAELPPFSAEPEGPSEEAAEPPPASAPVQRLTPEAAPALEPSPSPGPGGGGLLARRRSGSLELPAPPEAPAEVARLHESLLKEVLGDLHVLTAIVVSGASALSPVPFLDDILKGYADRRAFRLVGLLGGATLTESHEAILTRGQPKGCCALGCLWKAVIFPIKRFIRKLLFFLEIKRAVDQATEALATAWLFRWAVAVGEWPQAGLPDEETEIFYEAMVQARQSQGVQPLELAVNQTFLAARSTLYGLAKSFLKLGVKEEKDLSRAVEQVEQERKDEIRGLGERLTSSILDLSSGYLLEFTRAFRTARTELTARSTTPESPPG